MKTNKAIESLKVATRQTPLLTWDLERGETSVYKNDIYHNEFYSLYEKHQASFWTKKEVVITDDLTDWATMDESNKSLILNILRIFTQADASVLDGYSYLMKSFAPVSVKMMLSDFLNRESIHTDAYSVFTDTLGLSSNFYKEFLEIPEMNEKFSTIENAKVRPTEYYKSLNIPDEEQRTLYIKDLTFMMIVYSLFVEGIELFAMFSILFYYRVSTSKMKRLATIVEWSIRDESMHIMGNSRLINRIIEENEGIFDEEFFNRVQLAYEEVIQSEFNYIDFIYDMHEEDIPLNKGELKKFIRFIGNTRLKMIGLEDNKAPESNPFKWLDEILMSPTLTNFFSEVVTEYSNDLRGSRDTVRSKLPFLKESLDLQ